MVERARVAVASRRFRAVPSQAIFTWRSLRAAIGWGRGSCGQTSWHMGKIGALNYDCLLGQ